MTISEYIKNINQRYKTGISREHAYRGDLQNLLEGMLRNVLVTNEPARFACRECRRQTSNSENMTGIAREFYIGGYQPAEKWLKDRRDRTLSMEEIQHYQKIIVALMETDRLMSQIDEVFEEELG